MGFPSPEEIEDNAVSTFACPYCHSNKTYKTEDKESLLNKVADSPASLLMLVISFIFRKAEFFCELKDVKLYRSDRGEKEVRSILVR